MRMNRVFIVAVVCALTLIAVGCHKVVGGGWIDGLNGGKAHFGFQAMCEEGTDADGWPYAAFFVGQFQFQDKSAGVRFHGDIQHYNTVVGFPGDELDCEEIGAVVMAQLGHYAEIWGECRTQPGGVPGEFLVTLEDLEGEVGWDRNDTITIETNCTPDGEWYANGGTLKGGNISFPGHKSKPKDGV